MHSINRIFIVIFALSAFTQVGKTQEHGESAKPAEESKESKGKGNLKSTLPPWVELENKVQELQSKIRSKQGNLNALIAEKNHLANNSSELKNLIKQIVKEHEELRKFAADYEKNVNLLRYRFPERNAKADRTYDRIEINSVEEMEQALGVDGKLNRNLKRMRNHYHTLAPASEESPKPAAEANSPQSTKAEPSIEKAGSIILQK
jgi:chromosome segregation ATPase